MEDYLKDINSLVTRFAQVEQLKQSSEINDRTHAGLDVDSEPLILFLTPTIRVMTIDDLYALLLNQDALHAY